MDSGRDWTCPCPLVFSSVSTFSPSCFSLSCLLFLFVRVVVSIPVIWSLLFRRSSFLSFSFCSVPSSLFQWSSLWSTLFAVYGINCSLHRSRLPFSSPRFVSLIDDLRVCSLPSCADQEILRVTWSVHWSSGDRRHRFSSRSEGFLTFIDQITFKMHYYMRNTHWSSRATAIHHSMMSISYQSHSKVFMPLDAYACDTRWHPIIDQRSLLASVQVTDRLLLFGRQNFFS